MNDTPEGASQENGASPPEVESTAGSSGVVPATSAGEPSAQIQADYTRTRTIFRRRKRRQKN